MNRNLIARSVAILLLGVLFAYYIEHDRLKWRQLGREAFLAHETERYDSWIGKPHPASATVIGAIIVAGLFFGLYELVVLFLSAVLKSAGQAQEKPPGNSGVPFS
jgi:hypothetical protein